jgi:hypothetical protein
MSHQWKTPSYTTIGREGEWATWEINREERGRVCRDEVGRPGEQVAERGARAGLTDVRAMVEDCRSAGRCKRSA